MRILSVSGLPSRRAAHEEVVPATVLYCTVLLYSIQVCGRGSDLLHTSTLR